MSDLVHRRIDEGIKRGPKIKRPLRPPRKALEAPKNGEQGKLSNLQVQPILERYITGSTSSEIAHDLGVTRQGLAWWMRKHAEEDWKEAQVIQAVERKEQAQIELDSAPDALSLARARESLRSAQWDLERVCSRIFGPKQEVTMNIVPVLSITVAPMPNAALLQSKEPDPVLTIPQQLPDK